MNLTYAVLIPRVEGMHPSHEFPIEGKERQAGSRARRLFSLLIEFSDIGNSHL